MDQRTMAIAKQSPEILAGWGGTTGGLDRNIETNETMMPAPGQQKQTETNPI